MIATGKKRQQMCLNRIQIVQACMIRLNFDTTNLSRFSGWLFGCNETNLCDKTTHPIRLHIT